jgi:hypothetical protein
VSRRTPLVRDATRLKVVHRQRVQRQGDAEPAPPFERAAHGPTVIAAAADGWQRLLDTEYESVVVASWMTAALTRLGAPLDLLGAFGKIVEDEIRHVDLCAGLVEQMGGSPTIVRGPLPPLPTDLERGGAGELETVSALVGFFCVFEFLSGLIFHQALDAATTPLPHWAIGEIYRDEAFHGAFGFETARHFVPSWSDAWRESLARRVEDEVRRFEQRLGGPLPPSPTGRPAPLDAELGALERMGLLAPPNLLATFYAGVESQLGPRLVELGIPVVLGVARRP